MKFEPKKDIKRIIIVCLAAVIMALNIKSFVRTGGLYPGGATGLTPASAADGGIVFSCDNTIYHCQCSPECSAGLYRISVYREKIYAVFLSDDRAYQCTDGYSAGICDYL